MKKVSTYMKRWNKKLISPTDKDYTIYWIEEADGVPELKEKQLSAPEYLNQENTPEQNNLGIFKQENGIDYYKNSFEARRAFNKELEKRKTEVSDRLKLINKKLKDSKKKTPSFNIKFNMHYDPNRTIKILPLQNPSPTVFYMKHVQSPIVSIKSP